mgnify:CR=1 FL=1
MHMHAYRSDYVIEKERRTKLYNNNKRNVQDREKDKKKEK